MGYGDGMGVIVVFSTFPSQDVAGGVAKTLVDERLCACVNLVPIRSVYRWQGKVVDEPEILAIIKTTAARREALQARLVALHPYEVPEAIAVPAEGGHAPYLAWVADETG